MIWIKSEWEIRKTMVSSAQHCHERVSVSSSALDWNECKFQHGNNARSHLNYLFLLLHKCNTSTRDECHNKDIMHLTCISSALCQRISGQYLDLNLDEKCRNVEDFRKREDTIHSLALDRAANNIRSGTTLGANAINVCSFPSLLWFRRFSYIRRRIWLKSCGILCDKKILPSTN